MIDSAAGRRGKIHEKTGTFRGFPGLTSWSLIPGSQYREKFAKGGENGLRKMKVGYVFLLSKETNGYLEKFDKQIFKNRRTPHLLR